MPPRRPSPARKLVPRLAARLLACALVCSALARPAAAQAPIPLGATGPNFTKVPLGGGSVSLSQYSGKVVVLFLLGYS